MSIKWRCALQFTDATFFSFRHHCKYFPKQRLTMSHLRNVSISHITRCDYESLEEEQNKYKSLENLDRSSNLKKKDDYLSHFNKLLSCGRLSLDDAHYLLEYCGATMSHESAATKNKLFKYVWAELKRNEVKMDIGMWNSYLKCHIENGCNFCLISFLKELGEAKCPVEPNESTYELLDREYGIRHIYRDMIANLPQDGRILDGLHRYLLQLCGKNGNADGLDDILQITKSDDVKIPYASYHHIIKAYAEVGHVQKVDHTIQEMMVDGCRPKVKTYICLLNKLILGGHVDLFEKTLNNSETTQSLIKELDGMASELIGRGEFEHGFTILKFLNASKANALRYSTWQLFKIINAPRKEDIANYSLACRAIERNLREFPYSYVKELVMFLHRFKSSEYVLELFDHLISDTNFSVAEASKVIHDVERKFGYPQILEVVEILQSKHLLDKRSGKVRGGQMETHPDSRVNNALTPSLQILFDDLQQRGMTAAQL